MSDVDQRFHETWLGMLQPVVGLVASIPVLVEAQCAERLVVDAQGRLAAWCSVDADGLPRCEDLHRLLRELLGYPDEALVCNDLDRHALFVPEGPQVLQPTGLLQDPSAPDRPLILLWELPDALDLDRPETVTGAFHYPPTAKFDRLLRHAEVPIGLLSNGRAFRLLYAPSGEATGHLTFRLDEMLSVGGRPLLGAFVMLLSAHRLFEVAPERALPRILEDSRRWQARVSESLAAQVLDAAGILLDGLQDAARRDADAGLWEVATSDGDHVHRGILTSLLRIVFLLYAEDAGLMPVEHDAYRRGLAVATLYEQLRADANAYPDSMASRFGAWGYLLTAFRAVFLGASCGDLRLPPRRGALFDPHRFAFLEGWGPDGAAPIGDAEARAGVRVPTVSDATVLGVLDRLVMLQGQRISYRSLDVEQIGSVYEAMLGFTVERLGDAAVCLRGSRRWLTVAEVEEVPAGQRARYLKDAGLSAATAERIHQGFSKARGGHERLAALTLGAAEGPDRQPLVREPGALVLQPRSSAESNTSHYTPRSLCGPLVARTLQPLLRTLGEEPTPAQILSLKICDPAMGSGAFLVETCRYLADQLVAAWRREPDAAIAESHDDPVVVARRIVAQRCLYGVDRNADAVELAKLSLWLVTLARDLPFTFVDHALRHGDSIVGLGLEGIARFHWKTAPDDPVLRSEVDAALAEVLPIRMRIEELANADSPQEQTTKERLLWDAEDAIDRVRLVGDLVVAAFFGGGSVAEREALRVRYRDAAVAWLRDETPLPADIAQARQALRRTLPVFHWPLELSEIFYDGRRDPLEKNGQAQRPIARMDAFVGNMPFIGGRKIATLHGERYCAWICEAFEASGEVDYFAYFFLRANALLGDNGTVGLIAKSSVAEGDTRRVGLQRLLTEGLVIYDAHSKMPWPGDAHVLVSPVVLAKGTLCAQAGAPRLNDVDVATINSRLRGHAERLEPSKLRANAGCAFVGCFLRGEGFVLAPERAKEIVTESPREVAVVRRYLVGDDIAKHPAQLASRAVIDFAAMELEEASKFPKSMAIIEQEARPARERLRTTGADASHRRYWWRFANVRNDLRAWLATNAECFVLPRVAKHLLVARVSTDQVFSEQVVVFGLSDASALGVLQSRIHEVWVRLLSSTMGDGLRYSGSDCFDTFPFPAADPRAHLPAVAEVAERLEALRASYMAGEGVGLTVTYNRLKDAECQEAQILALRRLHEEMDRKVLDAYAESDPDGRWLDVEVPAYCPVRADDGRALESFEDAVLERLFVLNARRADVDARAGIDAKPAKKKPILRQRAANLDAGPKRRGPKTKSGHPRGRRQDMK